MRSLKHDYSTLAKAIKADGCRSRRKFCDKHSIRYCWLISAIKGNADSSTVVKRNGEYTTCVRRLLDATGLCDYEALPAYFTKANIGKRREFEMQVLGGYQAFEIPTDVAERTEFSRCMRRAIDRLAPNEQYVIRCRYFLGMTLKAIALKCGKSSERIRYIELKGIRKLRHPSMLRLMDRADLTHARNK